MGCCCCHFEAMSRDEHVQAESELLDYGIRWWVSTHPAAAEVTWKSMDVPISSKDFIHTIEYTTSIADQSSLPPLVLIHGFGFGAALYYAAAPALAEKWGGRVLSLDLLGCSLSTRPTWPHRYGHRCPLETAEAYWVDAIEAWRASLGLETMVLVGHSIGGYISAAYAERHPERISRLVLASPAGVPPPPTALAEAQSKAPLALKLVRAAFARGWSPFVLSKDLGMGRRMLSNYMERRFGDGLPWIPKRELVSYLTGVWCRAPKSAGGYMATALLTFGGIIPEGSQGEFVYARAPLADRLLALAKVLPRLSLIYGEFDWMFWRNAADMRRRQPSSAGELIDVLRVAQATHQLMIDNPMGFVDAVLATGSQATANAMPIGAGFGRHYGAKAKIFERASGVKLPQDEDYITIWAPGQ